MNAEIISIGDELLIGQIDNTNASFIADKLTEIGVEIKWITVIGDNEEQILESIATAENRSDVAIVTGGLGPTHDDITKNVFVKYFRSNLILDKALLQELRQRFENRKIKMVKANEEQALVPDNAKIIKNKIGTATGLLFEKNDKYFFVLPGVPIEMKTMTENFIIPFLKKKNKYFIKKRVLHFSGIPESTLFEKLGDIEKLERQAKIAFLPHFGIVDIRLTASGLNEQLCIKNIEKVEKIIREKVGLNIWGTDEETLEEVIIKNLIEQGKTLSMVEYGTRGEITAKLTRHQNPEKYFYQSFIISSLNEYEKLQGKSDPKSKPIEIVSEKTAKYLAANIKEKTNSDLGLAIVHDNQLETTSFIALSDSDQTICWSSAFHYEADVAIQRVVIAALHKFYHYISTKNLLD